VLLAELGERGVEPVHQLAEAAGQVDGRRVHVVERRHVVRAAFGDSAQQQPVQPLTPGALVETAEVPGTSVLGVEAPADAGSGGPLAQPLEVVVVEPEALPHCRRAGEVEHLRGGDARRAQVEQQREHRQQRVGLPERAVGEAHPQPCGGVRCRVLRAQGEGGGDQRREGLDIGAHDEDVARLERGVVGEQAEDDLAQHLHLSRAAVARVHLHAAVAAASGGGLVRTASPARSACRFPSSVRGWGCPSCWTISASGTRSRSSCWSSRTSRESETSNGLRSRSALLSSARRSTDGPVATASQSAGEAWCSHRWTSRCSASAARPAAGRGTAGWCRTR
jgi:hypothetical protein